MKSEPVFSGVAVALVTLFDDYLELDAAGTADLAVQLVDLGVKAVVVGGTTGEAAALDPDERSEVLAAVRKALPQGPGVPVIAGTGAPSPRQAARLTAAARDHGADAVLALSPPRTPNPRPYYEAVAEAASSVPVLAYHFPSVSPPGISLSAIADLPVEGMKDSSGDPGRLLETLDTWDRPVYPGNSALITLAEVPRLPWDYPRPGKRRARAMRRRLCRGCRGAAETGRAASADRGSFSHGPQGASGRAVRLLHEGPVGLETGVRPGRCRRPRRNGAGPLRSHFEKEPHEPGQQPQSCAHRPRPGAQVFLLAGSGRGRLAVCIWPRACRPRDQGGPRAFRRPGPNHARQCGGHRRGCRCSAGRRRSRRRVLG